MSNTYGHPSKSSDRTLDMCEPRLRCMPEHSMHMSIPRFKLAQSGFGELQSAHCPFPGTRVRMFCTSSARL